MGTPETRRLSLPKPLPSQRGEAAAGAGAGASPLPARGPGPSRVPFGLHTLKNTPSCKPQSKRLVQVSRCIPPCCGHNRFFNSTVVFRDYMFECPRTRVLSTRVSNPAYFIGSCIAAWSETFKTIAMHSLDLFILYDAGFRVLGGGPLQ